MVTICYAGPSKNARIWQKSMDAALRAFGDSSIFYASEPEHVDPTKVDFLLYAPNSPVTDLTPFSNLKAIQSLWAGVDRLISRTDLPAGTPVLRMVDQGLTQGMAEYVTAHVLRYHLGLDAVLLASREGRWDEDLAPPPASRRRVGIMGLGTLGKAVAAALRPLGFQLSGWSRSPKEESAITCFHGMAQLPDFLASTDILVILLPLTDETRGLLDHDRLALLPQGAALINAARGPILPEAALLRALEHNLAAATLDVFDTEPLPPEHAFWQHEKITITPHIASCTHPETASKEVVRQIGRYIDGLPFEHIAERSRGY
ncbi:MAG: glyoxylate/hydroxypyruvate reductase A [Neomegalonema sp.]|nr:glyoxylate/hydroxypyruvate reductase A [Neomegalonema sp.]